MEDSKSTSVYSPNGLIGFASTTVDPAGRAGRVRIMLTDGTDAFVDASDLQIQKDGSYFLKSNGKGDMPPSTAGTEETVVPVMAEELVIEKRETATGGIRVHKLVQEHQEVIAMSLRKEHVDIRRVIVGRDVEGPMPIRREGEVIIIPVVEEVFVVEKRMRLKEELYITRRTTEEPTEQTVTLQRETAVIERLDAEGRATPEEVPAQPPPAEVVRPEVRRGVHREARPLRRNKVIPEE